jgi:hypothetical protein
MDKTAQKFHWICLKNRALPCFKGDFARMLSTHSVLRKYTRPQVRGANDFNAPAVCDFDYVDGIMRTELMYGSGDSLDDLRIFTVTSNSQAIGFPNDADVAVP